MGAIPSNGQPDLRRLFAHSASQVGNGIGAKANQFGTWLSSLGKTPTLTTTAGPGLGGDATDAHIQAARSAEILRSRMMRGRAQSFLTGPTGLDTPPPLATKSQTGG